MAANVDPTLIALADLFARWRPEIKQSLADESARRELLQRLAGEEMESVLRDRGSGAARATFKTWLAAAKTQASGGRRGGRGKA